MSRFNLEDYETVEQRIRRFYNDYPSGRILTELVSIDGQIGASRWVVKATIFRDSDDTEPAGTGYAFEVDGIGMANKTSALENCETSAIGRGLANIGYSGDKRTSREEMEKVQRASAAPADWKEVIQNASTEEGLMQFYNLGNSAGWMNQEILAALTARKGELSGADAGADS